MSLLVDSAIIAVLMTLGGFVIYRWWIPATARLRGEERRTPSVREAWFCAVVLGVAVGVVHAVIRAAVS